jgi:hypothetical protein
MPGRHANSLLILQVILPETNMQKFLTFSLACIAFAVSLASSVMAYQQFITYRIAGKDILSITEGDHVDEDPWTLTLKVVATGGMSDVIHLESDGGFDECKQQLDYIIGSKSEYAEIVIDMNASTMNGVMMIQCATFHGLFGDGG